MELIIVGTNRLSVVIRRFIETEKQAKVVAFSTYREYIKEETIDGLPVIPFEDIVTSELYSKCHVLNTIGYSEMNNIRAKVFGDMNKLNMKIYTYISTNAIVYTDNIGEGSLIMPGAYVGPFVNVGKSCFIMMHTTLTHTINVGDFCFIAADTVSGGFVEIGNNCFIGMNSTIKNRITIAPYSMIGASSNVLKTIDEPECIYVGNPAKKIEGRKSIEQKKI